MNKSVLLLIALFIVSVPVTAQKKKDQPIVIPEMPVDADTKLITYSEVVDVDTTSAKILYGRAWSWANGFYVNPKDVIREASKEKGSILIKARYRIYSSPDKEGTKAYVGDVMYTLTLEVKENKYRYIITGFNWQKRSAYPIERWMDDKSDTFVPDYAYYLEQTDATMKELIASLKNRMNMAEKTKDDDW